MRLGWDEVEHDPGLLVFWRWAAANWGRMGRVVRGGSFRRCAPTLRKPIPLDLPWQVGTGTTSTLRVVAVAVMVVTVTVTPAPMQLLPLQRLVSGEPCRCPSVLARHFSALGCLGGALGCLGVRVTHFGVCGRSLTEFSSTTWVRQSALR